MEQELRKKAISRYLHGEAPKAIYSDLKRSKYWFFKWLKRYQTGEPDWFKDKSRGWLAPADTTQRDRKTTHSIGQNSTRV